MRAEEYLSWSTQPYNYAVTAYEIQSYLVTRFHTTRVRQIERCPGAAEVGTG